tara:strand:+ start:940 stop:1458 length:519 start_codon:yes stop_codon:yes gene_type:complete
MAIYIFARWADNNNGEKCAYYLVKTAIFKRKYFNVFFNDGDVRKNVPVNQIRIVQTSITRPHNDFDKISFKDLSIEILTKAIEIFGNYNKVNKYHRWDYVRQIVGLKDSPPLTNLIKKKYENFKIKRSHIINKTKKGPSLIKGKKRKRKFPPIPKQNKRNCLTMACNFQYSI